MEEISSRTSGYFFIMFGLLVMALFVFPISELHKYVDSTSHNFFIKYSLLIFVFNGALGSILYGILFLKKILRHYRLSSYDEKKKHNFLVYIIFSPAIITMSLNVYLRSESIFWKIAVTGLLINSVIVVASGIRRFWISGDICKWKRKQI